ncbi:MAG: LytTR family DNA-binding domain-containing protein [Roseburia sp.]|nr:LytTR family DNA-binding domain-containing protein [Roseburia sp.]
MQIAICDDDAGCCSTIEKWLQAYELKQKIKMNITIYNSADPLLDELKAGYWFDVIFLDIELPEQSGIDLGQIIRQDMQNETVSIVYISGKTKYCKDLFELEPLNYHQKPLNKKDIIADMDKVVRRYGNRKKVLTYMEDGVCKAILLSDIMYIEATEKRLTVVVRGNKQITIRESLTRLAEEFANYSMCQCHRSFMVNLSYVDRYLNRCFYMKNGAEIPVGRKYVSNVKNAWARYDLEV